MLLVLPADEAPNQPPLAVQLETPMLLEHDLARVPGTLLVPVPPKGLIIQNTARERPRGRDRSCP